MDDELESNFQSDFRYNEDSDDDFMDSHVPNVTMEEIEEAECEKTNLEAAKEAKLTKLADLSIVVTNQSQQMIANAIYECFSCKTVSTLGTASLQLCTVFEFVDQNCRFAIEEIFL